MDPMLVMGALFAVVALGVLAYARRRQGRGHGEGNTWGGDGGSSSGSDGACDAGSDGGSCDGGGGGD